MSKPREPAAYWNPYVGGVVLGLVLFLSFVLSGEGLGASGGIARILSFGLDRVAPGYVEQNPYLANLAGGVRNPLDDRMVWLLLGVLGGGFVSGLFAGRVKVETFKGPAVSYRARWLLAFAGGGFMGFGAGMARGCTSGQALSGGAVLGLGSWVFMMMVFAGAYALAYPLRRIWN